MKSTYTIKDLEHISGIKAHTLRIWEQRYNILKPCRTVTNLRTYSDKELKLVLNIALLQNKGHYKISKIASMTDEEIIQHTLNLSHALLDFPEQIQALTLSMLDLDEARFQKLSTQLIRTHGFESYMLDIIYPFLRRLGTLWISGSVGPAQEHFISHLIRQKIIAAIDAQDLTLKPGAKKVLMFLPDTELHEMGLLFANYVFRARNHSVVYLGQSLPYEELILAHEIHQPDIIFSVFTSAPNAELIMDYLQKLARDFTDCQVLLTGYQILHDHKEVPKPIQVIKGFDELILLVNEMN